MTRVYSLAILITTVLFYCCTTTKSNTRSVQNSVTDTLIKDSSRLAFYKGDTLGYVNYLFRNQARYIGKPLSEFLRDIDITVNTFSYSPNSRNRYKTMNLILCTKAYNEPPRIINGRNQEIEIGIGWQTFVPTDSIKAIINANGPPNHFNWSEPAKQYFGKQIIGNLWLNNYMKR